MIPREILKKIRQSEIRTNRIVTGSAAGARAQRSRITRAMEDRNYANKIRLNAKVNAVFFEHLHSGLASLLADRSESFRVGEDSLESGMNLGFKTVAHARLLLVVPNDRVFKFKPRFRVQYYLAAQERALIRSFNSARTCSHGIPLAGLRRSSSPRRSNSAICSGVGSSLKPPNSKSMALTSSRRSDSGIRRSSSRISALLMATIYSFDLSAQAAFSGRANCGNPVGVGMDFSSFPHGSSFLPPSLCYGAASATPLLGWTMQSLWDWPNRRSLPSNCMNSSFVIRHSSPS
jgi:hypothetical protein